jgi:hypothetical protein
MARSDRSASLARAAAIGALALAFGAPGASAADKKPAPAKTPLLTPAQLRDCLAQKDKLDKQTEAALKSKAAVDSDKAAIDASDAEIDSSGAALAEQAGTLDRTSVDAVNAYNAKVQQRQALIDGRQAKIDAYQAKLDAYNGEARAVLASKEAHDKNCANRRYDQRDLDDLQRKK